MLLCKRRRKAQRGHAISSRSLMNLRSMVRAPTCLPQALLNLELQRLPPTDNLMPLIPPTSRECTLSRSYIVMRSTLCSLELGRREMCGRWTLQMEKTFLFFGQFIFDTVYGDFHGWESYLSLRWGSCYKKGSLSSVHLGCSNGETFPKWEPVDSCHFI